MKNCICLIVLVICWTDAVAGTEARISLVEGSAEIKRKDASEWKPVRLNMPLKVDDIVKTAEESLVEITYRHGAVMRLAEQTSCSIKRSGDTKVATMVPKGNVWVNMKKLSSVGKHFEVTTPTAVAAIRGTVFQMQSMADSSTEVAVFDGKVAVGLSDEGKERAGASKKEQAGKPHEVPGPTEVPGPYEVTLDQWRTIVAGQRISIRANGRYATTTFDIKKKLDAFVEKNRALDALIKDAD